MKHVFTAFPAALALVMLLAPLGAQAERRAHVEVLFFAAGETSEENLYRLAEMTVAQAGLPAAAFDLFDAGIGARTRDIRLSNADYQMQNEYERLEKAPAYTVIWHLAWTQPRYQLGQEVAVKLLQQRREGLVSATARLIYNKLYRLQLDILYDVSPYQQETSVPQVRLLPVQFEKVMAAKKVYHLDHEAFGVLVKITELNASELAAQQPITSPGGTDSAR